MGENGTSSSLIERLKLKAAAAPPPATIAAPAKEPENWATCPTCSGKKFVKSQIPGAGLGAFTQCRDCSGSGTVWVAGLAEADVQGAQGAQGIVPPDAPPRTTTPAEAAELTAKKPRKKKEAAPAEAAPEPKLSIKVETETGEMKPLDTTAPTAAPTAAPVVPKVAAPVPTASTQKKSLVLLIDTLPVKGPRAGVGVMMEELIAPLMQWVAENHTDEKGRPDPKQDYRLISYTAKGELAAAIRKIIPDLPEVVLVSKFSPGADVFLEATIPHATEIHRGV